MSRRWYSARNTTFSGRASDTNRRWALARALGVAVHLLEPEA